MRLRLLLQLLYTSCLLSRSEFLYHTCRTLLFIYETNLQKEEEVSSRYGFEMGCSDAALRRRAYRNRHHLGYALVMGAVESPGCCGTDYEYPAQHDVATLVAVSKDL